jgi:hypothetical protein
MFGLQFHPVWINLFKDEAKPSRKTQAKTLGCIFYALDAHTQYTSQRAAKIKRAAAKKKQTKLLLKLLDAPPRSQ